MLDEPICVTCGTQYASAPQARCVICEEERQYVPPGGQAWTTLARLQRSHMAAFRHDGAIIGIGTSPSFAIGQRALLVQTAHGNILWDCISLIDPTMVELIRGLGGLAGIAISHPHYYTTMLEWSRAFGGVPIHLHEADREWVMRDGPEIAFWSGETKSLAPGLTLVHCGGHFEGGQLLHWAEGAAAIRAIAATVESWTFDALYGALWDRVISTDAKQVFVASIERTLHWLGRDAI